MTVPNKALALTEKNVHHEAEQFQRQMESSKVNVSASQLAHDLSNFLVGMRMLLKGMRQGLPQQSAMAQHVAVVEDCATSAAEICKQLQSTLRSAVISRNRQNVEQSPSVVDVSAMVDEMQGLLYVLVRRGVVLNIVLAENLPGIIANPTKLHRVLINLVRNASEAISGEGGSVTIRTGICPRPVAPGPKAACHRSFESLFLSGCESERPQSGDDYVFLEISDTGGGIDDENLKRIFEPSFTTKKKKDGHGLGLASVWEIVRDYGGTVTIDSRVGHGTTIRCIFPIAILELSGSSV